MRDTPALTLRSITEGDMTPEKAMSIGRMIGMSYKTVCIGSDMNPSSKMIKNSLISGLLSAGADVNDAGIAPVPAVSLASKGSECMLMVGEPDEQGVISRIDIMNSDGSIFTKEQLRQMITLGDIDRTLPNYKKVGTVRLCDSVTDDYIRIISEEHGRSTDAPVILDCGCGCTSACTPQILASVGADLTTINAQNDPKYSPRPPGVGFNDITSLRDIVNMDLGSIGLALNGDGTRLALIDEEGEYVDPENILALLLLYLRPSSVVVPFNASAVVDDAFMDIIGEGVATNAPIPNERRIIRADNDLEAITAAIIENDAEMGAMKDGTFIFPKISLCPDATNAAVILTKMSGENSISDLLASFPKYMILKEAIHHAGNPELFNKKLEDRLKELDAADVLNIDGWRIGMSEGWFTITRNSDNPEYVDITAEAKDKAYVVSMMELAKGIVKDCI